MKVYVVISNTIINGHSKVNMHGVYSTKTKAQDAAMSAIQHIAKSYYHHDVNVWTEGELEFGYYSDTLEIHSRCLEEYLQ